MSEVGKLIKSNNITWSQVELYLRQQNIDSGTINMLHTIFDTEANSVSTYTPASIQMGDFNIYDSTDWGAYLEGADNVFQEANYIPRSDGGNSDSVDISSANLNLLRNAINGIVQNGNTGYSYDYTNYYNDSRYPDGSYVIPIQIGQYPLNGTNPYANLNQQYPVQQNYNMGANPYYRPYGVNFGTQIQQNQAGQPTFVNPQQNVTRTKKEYPNLLKKRIEELIKNNEDFTINEVQNRFILTITSGERLEKYDLKYIRYVLDDKGKLITQSLLHNDGKQKDAFFKGGRRIIEHDSEIDPKWVQFADDFMKTNPSENASIEYNKDSKEYTITQTDARDESIEKIVTIMSEEPVVPTNGKTDKKENYAKTQTITYKDGKVVTYIYENGNITRKRVEKEADAAKTEEPDNTEESRATEDKQEPKLKLRTPTKIKFKLPKDAPIGARIFTSTLCNQKGELMKLLNIDSDKYNMLAETAVGIAGKETQMDSWTPRRNVKQAGIEILGVDSRNWSMGMTQIRFKEFYKNPPQNKTQEILKKQFDKVGITKPEDLNNQKNAAIATMIILATLDKELDAQPYQDGVKKAEELTVTKSGWELDKNGIAQHTGNTKPWQNKITRQDELWLLWNNKKGRQILKNGTFKPQSDPYMNVASKYTKKYELVEDAMSRKLAEQKEKELIKKDIENTPYKNMGINGPMGSVVFMPGMYKDNKDQINTDKEIKILEDRLKKKNINSDLISKLTKAIKNQELGFEFGLTEQEIDSLTDSDIKLLLTHLNKVKNTIGGEIETSDGITTKEAKALREQFGYDISKAEDNFRQEYLTKHSPTYETSAENPRVLRGFSTASNQTNYVTASGKRRGFQHQKALGVNTSTTNGTIRKTDEILARAAHNVVSKNPSNSSGECLTGVKEAMKEAGIDVSGMAKYGSVPKYALNWFEEMASKGVFTKVEYVSTSSDKSRAITDADIPRLPAGYFVIFVPGEGYDNQAGHIAITNGNGQGYSDSTDNLAWGRYTTSRSDSGKGEHSKFYVYKLSDKWSVDAATGKLKLNM